MESGCKNVDDIEQAGDKGGTAGIEVLGPTEHPAPPLRLGSVRRPAAHRRNDGNTSDDFVAEPVVRHRPMEQIAGGPERQMLWV